MSRSRDWAALATEPLSRLSRSCIQNSEFCSRSFGSCFIFLNYIRHRLKCCFKLISFGMKPISLTSCHQLDPWTSHDLGLTCEAHEISSASKGNAWWQRQWCTRWQCQARNLPRHPWDDACDLRCVTGQCKRREPWWQIAEKAGWFSALCKWFSTLDFWFWTDAPSRLDCGLASQIGDVANKGPKTWHNKRKRRNVPTEMTFGRLSKFLLSDRLKLCCWCRPWSNWLIPPISCNRCYQQCPHRGLGSVQLRRRPKNAAWDGLLWTWPIQWEAGWKVRPWSKTQKFCW